MLTLSRYETIIINAVRKAAIDGSFEVPCPTLSAARSGRAQAYNLIKKVRGYLTKHPGDSLAQEILTSAEEVSLSLGESSIIIRRKDQSEAILAFEAALEASGEVIQEVMAPELEAMMKRLQERQG